jgi:hypothetical protein
MSIDLELTSADVFELANWHTFIAHLEWWVRNCCDGAGYCRQAGEELSCCDHDCDSWFL